MGKRGKLPGLSWRDFADVIRADGWVRDDAAQHENYEHPVKRGKVSLDKKWKDVSTKNMVFHSVLRQAGLTKKEFEALYWATRGR